MDSVTSYFWNEESGNTDRKTSVLREDKHQDMTTSEPTSDYVDNSLSKHTSKSKFDLENIKEKHGKVKQKSNVAGSDGSSTLQQIMTDTLVEKVIKMALPPTSDYSRVNIETRTVFSKTRPSLSVQVMSNNFVQMNSRLSIPFIIINEIIRLANWENIPFTLSILAMVTFTILKPLVAVTAGPLFYILFGIMVPKYMYVHKPNQIKNLNNNNTPAQGPPLRKAVLPEPVPELSQEFVLNLTDLQNHMLVYVWLYDTINSFLRSFAFFVNEQISCLVFIILLVIALFNLLFIEDIIRWIPIKFLLIVLVWGFGFMLHPNNRDLVLQKVHSEDTRLKILTFVNSYESFIKTHLRYVEAKENKMVRIFEIQKYRQKYKEWRTVGFSSDDYCLFSDLRIKELDIKDYCTKLLDDVKPPLDWDWISGSSWVLDLNPQEWVQDNFIQNVEVDSETKWVYDIDFDGNRGEYRRRMWSNVVTRKIEAKEKDSINANIAESDDNQLVEEIVNPLREEIADRSSNFHGVARGSLAGARNSSMISEDISANDSVMAEENSDDGNGEGEGSFNGVEDMVDILNTAV